MIKILFSGCLLGELVKYHGGSAFCDNPIIEKWKSEGRIVSICPEVSAGLPVPRPSSEIIGGSGVDVLKNNAQVFSHTGINRTEAFIIGAKNTLEIVNLHKIRIAILKSKSPSCGNNQIYDGTYSGTIISGSGVTAALLIQNNVRIFNENELESADAYLKILEDKCKYN